MPSILQCYKWDFQKTWTSEHKEGHDVPPDEMHATQTHLSNNPIYYQSHVSPVNMRDLAVGMLVGTRKDDDETCKQFFEKNCVATKTEDADKEKHCMPKYMIGQCLVPLKEGQTKLSVQECLESQTFVETSEENQHTETSKTLSHIGKAHTK